MMTSQSFGGLLLCAAMAYRAARFFALDSKKVSTSVKNSSYHHGDLKESLVDAAKTMITQEGLASFSLRKAALAVGVSQAALYRHFSGKEELLAALARNAFLDLGILLQQAYEKADPDPRVQLKAVGLAYVIFANENPNLYRLMFDASLSDKQRYAELTDARRQALKWAAKSVTPLFNTPSKNQQIRLDNTKFLLQSSIHGVASFVIEGLAPNYKTLENMIDALVDHTLISGSN